MKKVLALVLFLCCAPAFAQAVGCGPNAVQIATGLTTTSYTDGTVLLSTSYAYTATAVLNGVESTCTPETPAAMVTIPGTGTGHSVALSWTASTTTGVTYNVYRVTLPNPPTNLKAVGS